ncbi:HYR domain-containing protein [Ancylomarina sp. 16SWW S1-10-2]|uniref:HYR domain-containing protein n=1 Tax=Ancylomarina sp. 16SWW S1-10-2 TaxID=2499681 RepID=UPI0012AE382C|nr:HYR domain-containing protein [Ancylomarina sp. 16SWW S1-10-2]MRT94527.1 HYR domain-containing protein [Ancylomarina sp. 16SWW S1-10-2]
MKHFYIQFSLFVFFLSLSGSLFGQTTYKIDDPSPTTFVQTGDFFYDTGGSTGNYENYEDESITFKCAEGSVIRVTFTEFEIEYDYDFLTIYDGIGTGVSQIAKYSGTATSNVLVTSTGNSITFNFDSDISVTKSGWKATIEVVTSPCSKGSSPIWSEDFEGINKGWTKTGRISKTTYPAYGSGGNGIVGVNLDNTEEWVTNSIDISNFTDIRVSMDLGSWGNQLDDNDYLRIYYSVDGGDDVEFLVNGTHTNDISAQTSCTNIPDGDELTVKVIMKNNHSNEYYYIDNVIVTGEAKRSDAVSLSVSPSSIDEYDGTSNITASLVEAQTSAVTVYLNYSGADASNYSAVSQIVIPAGDLSASITLSAVDNDNVDGDRDVLVQITSVDNGVESGTQRKTITIVDDDELSEIEIPFQQRTSQNSPETKVYNIKGDFTMIGNTNLTLNNYRSDRNNSNYDMEYVDVDSDASTFNSSSATLTFSEENGAKPQCSDIIYAGLYWTGRANSGSITFTERISGINKTLDKRKVLIKHAGEAYQTVTARDEDIHYPNGSGSNIYAAYAEVTDYVQTNGIGEYFVADMALSDGNGGSTGFCGGWGLVVVYKNSKMKWRDVTLYDGYAYVSHSGGGNTSYDFPISGFKAVQSGDVNIKLGLMASEGDVGISGDFIQIESADKSKWTSLSHDGNTTNNFFNSSIITGGNDRNPNLTNNTGLDISMFDVPNVGNLNIANEQTRTKFRYGTNQDAYAIFALAMAVDAYVPEAEATNAVMTINGAPIADGSMVLPGQEIVYQLDIRNRGTEVVNDLRIVLPIAYTTDFVDSDATVDFSPAVNNYYYDPTEGATGSIIWEIGNLPVPSEGPDQILGSLTYTVKVTEDCSILGNPNCSPSVGIGGGGGSTGIGANSGTSITGFSIIQGYVTDGECVGEPITTPIEIQIDAEDYVKANCTTEEIDSGQEYFFCNLGASGSIPIGEVSDNFPTGCRFYADYPIIDGTTEEFTVSNDFLADEGTKTYYAVPPGYTSCYYTFKITVKNISSVPLVSDETYCQGSFAGKLVATPSVSTYKLYYYTEETGGTPLVSLIPNTDVVGVDTYYVAEGESASCLSPNREPLEVTVNPLPDISSLNFSVSSPVCLNTSPDITVTGLLAGTNYTIGYNDNGTSKTQLITTDVSGNCTFAAGSITTDATYNIESVAFNDGDSNCQVAPTLSAKNSMIDNSGPTIYYNYAFNKTAIQSSDNYAEGKAAAAVDGNTDGVWGNHSVTHTQKDIQSWWQVDLGAEETVDYINVYRRTGCCTDRLVNFYVLLSNNDLQATTLADALVDPNVESYYVEGDPGDLKRILTSGNNARYVKIQLTGQNFLSLAEVEVMGSDLADIELDAEPSKCSAIANWSDPEASSNCGTVTLISNYNSGDDFPVGKTTVTYTATDGTNETTSSFDVTVNDNLDPIISNCPENITVEACNNTVNWTAPTATDNCNVTLTSIHNSGDTFPIGTTTTVTYTATDDVGNDTEVSFTVTVNPSFTVDAGSDKRICQGESVTLSPTVSPAAGTYSYQWRIEGKTDILASTKDYTFNAVGDPDLNLNINYEVTATDLATSCSSTDVIRVTILSLPTITTVTSSNPSCPDLSSGSITFSFPDHSNRSNIKLSIDGGVSYSSVSDNITSSTFTGLVAGTYDLSVIWGNNECPIDLGDVTLELENISDMNFSYTQSAYCTNELDPAPSITTAVGVFTSTDGLSIDSTTGVIDLSVSTAGTYVVTYTIDGECGGSSTQEITINPTPKPIGIFFE